MVDGTATQGVDYFLVSQASLIMRPGENTASLTVTILDDLLFETNESFSVQLVMAAAFTLESPLNAVIDIVDDGKLTGCAILAELC